MKTFRPSKLQRALVMAGVAFASSSIYAQQQAPNPPAADDQIEVIEVTGFSTSLIQALNQKRFSDTVSEQLSADDLGGLPDVSMADALTRLPGISAVRTGGQAAEINIRGLSGGFVFSTLNGREQVSTSGKRSIEFDQYPSELISSAAVYKSPKASLIEGGVAGTVELKTASPLSNEQQHKVNVNLRGMFNDRAEQIPDAAQTGHRFSVSYQGKFMDDTLGLALGYARLFQPSVSTQFAGLKYDTTLDADRVEGDTDNFDPNSDADQTLTQGQEFFSEGMELQHRGGEETRDGVLAVIEWAPTDNFTLKADGFYSKFQTDAFARGLRVKFGGQNAEDFLFNPVIQNNAVVGGNIIRNADSNAFTRVETVNDDNTETDEITSLGLNAHWLVNDNLTFNFDLAYSKADSDFRNGLLWALVGEDASADTPVFDDTFSISYLLNGLNLPSVGFSQEQALSDISRVMVSKYGIYPFVNSDQQDSYKFDLTYQLQDGPISSVEAGFRYSGRTYTNDRSVFEYGDDGAFSTREPPLRLTPDLVEVVSWGGEFANFPDYLKIDLDGALDAWFPNGRPQPVQTWGAGNSDVINAPDGGRGNTAWSVLQSGEVYEEVFAAYVMANIDTEIFGLPVTGNFGVRMVKTDQSATALEDVNGDPELGAQNIADQAGLINSRYAPKILGIEYTDYLPQLNLNFGLTDNQQLRFAAAKVMSRPPINRLAAQISTNVSNDGEISGNSENNPFLRPFYATQYDLSYEYYFTETDGAFIAALFYKDIESKIDTFGISNFDFAANGFNVPAFIEDPVSGAPRPTFNGTYTTAVNNADGGYLRGVELSYTQVFSFLPAPFNELGLTGSYSYTESEITTPENNLSGRNTPLTLEGLSKNIFNSTLFWSYEAFETRLSVRFRDDFVSEQVAVDAQTVNFDSEMVVDYQASYEVNDRLGLLFQVNNLTDEPTQSYFVEESQTGTIQFFGRQFFFGVTYSL